MDARPTDCVASGPSEKLIRLTDIHADARQSSHAYLNEPDINLERLEIAVPQFASVLAGYLRRLLFTAGGLPPPIIFQLPLIWMERARFRARLWEDLENRPHLLRDIGISVRDAQSEAARLFWEPVLLKDD
jgi:uncharacterized protein YjiS (DUF1127 family)